MMNSFEMAPANLEKILDLCIDSQEADGFVGHNDVPLCEQVFEIMLYKTHRMEHHLNGLTDDLRGGKPMGFVEQYHLTIFADRHSP